MAIDHDDTALMLTIERYLRGELSAKEEEEWEEHYFQCEQCFKALEGTARIAQFIKHERRRRHGPTPAQAGSRFGLHLVGRTVRDWLTPAPAWRPVLAAAMIVVVVGIAAVWGWLRVTALRHQVEQLRMPTATILSYVLEEGVRGESPSVTIPADGGRVLLQFNLIAHQDSSTVRTARIQDDHGRVVWTASGLRGQGRYGTFAISCHTSFFTPGDYELLVDEVRGDDGTVLSSAIFPFRVAAAAGQGTGQ